MSRFNVFLDTNVFMGANYNFEQGSLLNLKKYCDSGVASLVTNDIITREVRHHIATDVLELARKAKNAIKKEPQLLITVTQPVFESIQKTLLDAPTELIKRFDAYINKAQFLSNSTTSITDLFDDYFEFVAPFEKREEKKHEFPDAAVIMSIKKCIENCTLGSIHVVTDDNGWHNALKDVHNVNLYKDLKSLLTSISKEEELYSKITAFLADQIGQLEDLTESWLLDQDWSCAVEDIEMCIECDSIDDVELCEITLVPSGVEYIDKEEQYAATSVSGTAKLKIGFSYIDHSCESYDREDHIWYNTKYGDCEAIIEVPIQMTVTVLISDDETLDMDKPDFEDFNSDAEIVEYTLNEHNDEIHDPYYNICSKCGEPIGIHNDGGDGKCANCTLED